MAFIQTLGDADARRMHAAHTYPHFTSVLAAVVDVARGVRAATLCSVDATSPVALTTECNLRTHCFRIVAQGCCHASSVSESPRGFMQALQAATERFSTSPEVGAILEDVASLCASLTLSVVVTTARKTGTSAFCSENDSRDRGRKESLREQASHERSSASLSSQRVLARRWPSTEHLATTMVHQRNVIPPLLSERLREALQEHHRHPVCVVSFIFHATDVFAPLPLRRTAFVPRSPTVSVASASSLSASLGSFVRAEMQRVLGLGYRLALTEVVAPCLMPFASEEEPQRVLEPLQSSPVKEDNHHDEECRDHERKRTARCNAYRMAMNYCPADPLLTDRKPAPVSTDAWGVVGLTPFPPSSLDDGCAAFTTDAARDGGALGQTGGDTVEVSVAEMLTHILRSFYPSLVPPNTANAIASTPYQTETSPTLHLVRAALEEGWEERGEPLRTHRLSGVVMLQKDGVNSGTASESSGRDTMAYGSPHKKPRDEAAATHQYAQRTTAARVKTVRAVPLLVVSWHRYGQGERRIKVPWAVDDGAHAAVYNCLRVWEGCDGVRAAPLLVVVDPELLRSATWCEDPTSRVPMALYARLKRPRHEGIGSRKPEPAGLLARLWATTMFDVTKRIRQPKAQPIPTNLLTKPSMTPAAACKPLVIPLPRKGKSLLPPAAALSATAQVEEQRRVTAPAAVRFDYVLRQVTETPRTAFCPWSYVAHSAQGRGRGAEAGVTRGAMRTPVLMVRQAAPASKWSEDVSSEVARARERLARTRHDESASGATWATTTNALALLPSLTAHAGAAAPLRPWWPTSSGTTGPEGTSTRGVGFSYEGPHDESAACLDRPPFPPLAMDTTSESDTTAGAAATPSSSSVVVLPWARKFLLFFELPATSRVDFSACLRVFTRAETKPTQHGPSSGIDGGAPTPPAPFACLWIADQHAVHERLRLEYFCAWAEAFVVHPELVDAFHMAHDTHPSGGDRASVVLTASGAVRLLRYRETARRLLSQGPPLRGHQACGRFAAPIPPPACCHTPIPADMLPIVRAAACLLRVWGWRFDAGVNAVTHWPTLRVEGVTLTLDSMEDLHVMATELADTGPHHPSSSSLVSSPLSTSSVVPSGVLRFFISRSCRGAIMFGDALSVAQARLLLGHVAHVEQFYICSHGRPSFTRLRTSSLV